MNVSSRLLQDPHPRQCPTRAEMASGKQEIQRLDQELTNLKTQIEGLQAQFARLQRERDNYASYISPFRCLPTEILTEIVHLCLENRVPHGDLMKTCGTIRNVVNGTPTFWNKIQICPNFRYHPSKGHHCSTTEHLDFILKRVNSTPLDLSIDMEAEGCLDSLAHLLSSHKCKIRSLHVQSCDVEDVSHNLANLNMSTLQNLSLYVSDNRAMEMILDLAAQSRQEQMIINLNSDGRSALPLLQHSVVQRATELRIWCI
ncbi:hypothetical protein CPB86DRAFT_561877 [Serendipita vermifera]|nr:hypothetical protein CPB86DRAFT_561877 [Serendipita vermifera]